MSTTEYRTLVPLFEELHGERVIVRPYHQSDAQALFEAVAESREHIRPWLPFADAHQTVEESLDWIIHQEADWLLRENMVLGIWERASGLYLGGTGLHIRNWELRYFEIGYWLRTSALGHGYMTEAVQLLTDYAFTSLAATRVEIRCDERNVRSAAIPRRLGFVQEARLRNHMAAPDGTFRNTLIFSLIPTDREKHNLQG
ncbi:MAG TPA: GNAT family N-acetyltransferase [Ktedonobacteraceae bacterium]|nr:GNAT family N-acetyltransferase [Ktedonobacteraceae bacterium]